MKRQKNPEAPIVILTYNFTHRLETLQFTPDEKKAIGLLEKNGIKVETTGGEPHWKTPRLRYKHHFHELIGLEAIVRHLKNRKQSTKPDEKN